MPYRQPPKDTFGMATLKGAGYGAMIGGILSADGNPFIAVPIGAAVGTVVGASKHVVDSIKYANENTRRKKAAEEITARREARRHAALNNEQFKDIK